MFKSLGILESRFAFNEKAMDLPGRAKNLKWYRELNDMLARHKLQIIHPRINLELRIRRAKVGTNFGSPEVINWHCDGLWPRNSDEYKDRVAILCASHSGTEFKTGRKIYKAKPNEVILFNDNQQHRQAISESENTRYFIRAVVTKIRRGK